MWKLAVLYDPEDLNTSGPIKPGKHESVMPDRIAPANQDSFSNKSGIKDFTAEDFKEVPLPPIAEEL